MSLKRILFVFAHPDDESFTSGVTIAKYAREGETEISLLCATRGQAGKAGDPPLCSPAELPQFRERELYAACGILGIKNVELLDYEDKRLQEVPTGELVGQIQAAIRRYRPQIVITFPPHGISGHPDHRTISAATGLAVTQLAPDESPVRKLYHVTLPSTAPFANRHVHTDPEESITTIITAPGYVPIAAEALLAHRTQHLSVERVFPGVTQGDYANVRDTNTFILAWCAIPGYRIAGKESDLFAGLDTSTLP
ncbi:PIG-L family deacetylase [Brevibacillus sp. SYP-B805]|uniref:PIG-L deacetylase family protein n=1 Tax=Brevibacillus sp. SYP-B805 TaxID=1578199 RepID=UPI0013EA9DE3|nr:PIG-L family deacetylase [Brevibacillus sp. SYP-B805]NGQ94606.1 PIG-L family deacetylase [Brevibacillus sp. SYP-B805]